MSNKAVFPPGRGVKFQEPILFGEIWMHTESVWNVYMDRDHFRVYLYFLP